MTDSSRAEIDTAHTELVSLFGTRYKVTRHLGTGAAGIVFEVKDTATGMKRVAKLLRKGVRDNAQLKADFENEAKKLAGLRHPNLVTVYEQSPARTSAPYFVMEFVKGRRIDAALAELGKRNSGGKWVAEVRAIFLQLADALAYLHSQKPRRLLHLDVKPENVILTRNFRKKALPILLDFGIAQFEHQSPRVDRSQEVRGTLPMWPKLYQGKLKRMTHIGRSLFRIERALLTPQLDLHLLGRTLSLCLEAAVKTDSIERHHWDPSAAAEYRFLREVAGRLDIDVEGVSRYANALALRTALRRVDLQAGRASSRTGHGVVKIPGRSIATYGPQIRKLTDCQEFQRLRGIKQLGVTYLVYPGAVHTRFEHSLGVFQNAIEVLDQLAGQLGDFRFRSVVTEEELIATAIVGLLHDIGHYPFAHQFRLAGLFPRHEDRSLEVIQGDRYRQLITSEFNRDVYTATVQIMRAVISYEATAHGHRARHVSVPNHFQVLRAILSSPVDADKLDYVFRDAHHAGVPYGKIVDVERLLGSLRVWWAKDGDPQLLLSDKGRVCAEALIFARYLMTSEVYWNHAVRAYAAMLSAAIETVSVRDVNRHLWDVDLQFLDWLDKGPKTAWFVDLVQRRRPYRRAFVHQRLGGRASEYDGPLFDVLEGIARDADEKGRARLRKAVAAALGIAVHKRHEIVIDVPQGMTRIRGVRVLPEGHEEPGEAGRIFDAIGENFDGFVRKARIFVHPDLMSGASVAESTEVVRKALIEEYAITP